MILGRYRPRLLVLTTPNHAFNKRFESSSKVPQTGRNFTDSTGRTTRTFRHLDHKFEWDIPECAAWCHDIATAYGYKVELGGIGEGVESDGKVGNSEPASRYASQTMVFRRRDRGRPQPCRRATLPSSLDHFERLLTIDDVSANAPELEEVPVDRTPRSRRPEYLPWLSSPRSCSDGAALFGTRASAQQDESEQRRPLSRKLMDEQVSEGLDMPLSPGLEDDGSDRTPHELVYAGTFPAFDSGSKSASTVKAMIPDEDIVSAVLDRLFALAPAQRGISDRAEVRSRLWDVWIDSRVRGLCEGKIVRLLDALRLVPPAEDEESEGSPAQRPPKRARSSGPKSSKEGGPMIVDVGNAEDPFVARKARERLVASDGREFELRLARNADYADDQADLWLVYYAAEAEGWLVETESEDPRQRSPNRGGSEGGGMAIAASWAE